MTFGTQRTDDDIRAALRVVEAKGKLNILAIVSAFPGGESRLRNVMESTGEMHFLDRQTLEALMDGCCRGYDDSASLV